MSIFTEMLRAFNLAKIGGKTDCIVPVITTTAVQYTSGDSVGGIIKIADAVKYYNGTAILKAIHVKDASNQKQPLTILIFDSLPTGATATDNSVFAYGTSYPQQIAKVNVVAGDYETVDSKATADIDTIAKGVKSANNGLDLYAVIVTTGTPTYGANSTSLSICFCFLQD